MKKSPFNLDETLAVAKKDFAQKNPLQMAANSGCLYETETGRFMVPLLGENYLVQYPAGEVFYQNRREAAPLIVSILILHYLVRASGVELSGDWISFKELQGGAIYIEPFKHRAIIPFTRRFGDRPQDFARAAEKLGAQKTSHGNIAYVIPALPRVPLLYILWLGDDEFPASGNILFDRYANAYLHTEDYAMLGGMTVASLLAALK